MFIYIVSLIGFVLTSLAIVFAVVDTFGQFSLTPWEKAAGGRANYFTARFAVVVALWVLTGWYLFG
jgi:hypothetical protein